MTKLEFDSRSGGLQVWVGGNRAADRDLPGYPGPGRKTGPAGPKSLLHCNGEQSYGINLNGEARDSDRFGFRRRRQRRRATFTAPVTVELRVSDGSGLLSASAVSPAFKSGASESALLTETGGGPADGGLSAGCRPRIRTGANSQRLARSDGAASGAAPHAALKYRPYLRWRYVSPTRVSVGDTEIRMYLRWRCVSPLEIRAATEQPEAPAAARGGGRLRMHCEPTRRAIRDAARNNIYRRALQYGSARAYLRWRYGPQQRRRRRGGRRLRMHRARIARRICAYNIIQARIITHIIM